MKDLKNFFFGKVEIPKIQHKNSNAHTSLHFLNNDQGSKADYASFADEAYSKNVIVFRAINLIASAAASVPWKLHIMKNGKKIELHEHPILDLLHHPTPLISGASFFESLFSYKLISGNCFVYALKKQNGLPFELHLLRPDTVKIIPGLAGIPKFYQYNIGEKEIKIPVDKLTGKSDILHIKSFNPMDHSSGMSALASASFSIDQHNESSKWNLSMLKNAARPSGALVMKSGADNNFLTQDQCEDIRSQLNEIYCSSSNTGRPILLQGGLEWQELSLSPKDMDFIEAKHSSARDIALAFGVPPQLLGIPGDSTYNNMQEARLALWEDSILPMLDHVIDSLNNWLIPMFDTNLRLYYDIDEISSLSIRREKLWSKIENASFLTINEKRKIIGLSPIANGDELCKINH